MLIAALAAALLTAPMQDPQVSEEPVKLEDITVTGRSLDRMIQDFVGEVSEPNRGRGLARWNRTVCVGAANLRRETAEYLVDRVSTVAEDLGLQPGGPGCSPNILIVATHDGQALAREMVAESQRAFHTGGAGTDRGLAALAAFQQDDRAVRWWQQAMPIDSQTGMRAVRLPADCAGSCTSADESVMEYAPVTNIFSASRLSTQIVDSLFRAVVIVDMDELPTLSVNQLADYIAMVSLAQIDPDADTGSWNSILNVLDDPEGAAGLTTWDTAYLQGLYGAERGRRIPSSDQAEVRRSIRAEHERLRGEQQD